MPNAGVYLQNFSSEELESELKRRREDKAALFREANRARHAKLTKDFIDFLAPVHSGRCGEFDTLRASGISHCNRCTLDAMRQYPESYEDVRLSVTLDFDLTRQMSFK